MYGLAWSATRSITKKRKMFARLTSDRATPAMLMGLRSNRRNRVQRLSWEAAGSGVIFLLFPSQVFLAPSPASLLVDSRLQYSAPPLRFCFSLRDQRVPLQQRTPDPAHVRPDNVAAGPAR